MNINKIRIKDKFNQSKGYISLIETILKSSMDDFISNFDNQVKAERSFEVITQIMLDVCTHIISVSQTTPPTSYSDCMIKLSTLGILNSDKSKNLSNLVKLRNIIVHQYDAIDNGLLYVSLKELLTDFKEFQVTILNWIQNLY